MTVYSPPTPIEWRQTCFLEMGVPEEKALALAVDVAIDLHDFETGFARLLERGCPPELAVKILLPL